MSNYSIQKILVPVDLSETSLNALDTAVYIAKNHDAQLYILFVRDNAFEFYESDESFYSLTTDSENSTDVLQALTGTIQHKHGIKPKLIIREGYVSPTIVKEGFKNNCDLIVI